MGSSDTLYNRLFDYLRSFHSDTHVSRIRIWVWIMVGMVLSHSVQLSEIAQHLPTHAAAAGRIMQVRRWLSNRFVAPIAFYRPLIQHVLQYWTTQAVYVILDATAVNKGKLQILRLSLSHCYRALPLTWLVLAGTGLMSVTQAAPLLTEAFLLLSRMASVTFLADRGFRDTEWAQVCLKKGWNYLIRIANSTYVTLPDGRPIPIEKLGVKPGQRRYFKNVQVTKEKAFVCNLMVTWTHATPHQAAELCAVITNLEPRFHTLQQYLKRMHIEESFRDDKSGSFQLAQTHLRDVERLNHLLLAVSVLTLWIHEIGQDVLKQDERREIDPAHTRQLSVFQLGWRKLKRTISRRVIPAIHLLIRPMRLAPVIVKPKAQSVS